MATRRSRKKTNLKKNLDEWHLKLAYSLGRSVKKASQKIDKAKKTTKKRSGGKARSRKSLELARLDSFTGKVDESLAPILKELKGIADVSGLTAALEEMNAISLKHSSHPVVNRLIAKINALSPSEQEILSRKFIERLQTLPYMNNAFYSMPTQGAMAEEDSQKIFAALIGCVSQTLEDIGMSPEEREFLKNFSDEVTRPLNELMQFFMHPKKFSQKVKRLWRIQRILIKMIKLINMSNALALKNGGTFAGPISLEGNFPAQQWMGGKTQPIVIKEGDVKAK